MRDESTHFMPLPSDGSAPGGKSGSTQLVVVEGTCQGMVVNLFDQQELTIGRRTDNDVVLNSPSISKHHARILREVGGYVLEDLDSMNGSSINGLRLAPNTPRALAHGDSLGFGDHLLLFRQSGSFSDKTGMSTIAFDVSKVREEVNALLDDLPDLRRGD